MESSGHKGWGKDPLCDDFISQYQHNLFSFPDISKAESDLILGLHLSCSSITNILKINVIYTSKFNFVII